MLLFPSLERNPLHSRLENTNQALPRCSKILISPFLESMLSLSRVCKGKTRVFMPLNAVWEEVAQHKFEDASALPYVGSIGKQITDFKGRKLRGSGIHGPERSDLMKLILWNRIRVLRPQRTEIPSEEDVRDKNRMDVSLIWFFLSIGFIFLPYSHYVNHYASHHDQFPFMPPRTDGSHGVGAPHWWFE